MPRSNIFVIWNEKEIADKVKEGIEARIPDYRVVVGGETRGRMTIPETIVEEMRSCDRAIVLIEGHYKDPKNSNVMYELGYAISIYGYERTSIFLIGQSADWGPSDIRGTWLAGAIQFDSVDDSLTGEQKKCIEKIKLSDDRLKQNLAEQCIKECKKSNYFNNAAKLVCDRFLRLDFSFKTKKIDILLHYYGFRELITDWGKSPTLTRFKCSEKDLSIFLLFFVQGAEFYDDYKDLREEIRKINRTRRSLCEMLQDSIAYSLNFLDFFLRIMPNDPDSDARYQLDLASFNRVVKNFTDLKQKYENKLTGSIDNEEREFSHWLLVSIDEILPYVHLVRACSVKKAEDRDKLLNEVIGYGKGFISRCEELEKIIDKDDQGILELLQAYNYRNLSTAFGKLKMNSEAKEASKESYDLRKHLYVQYCNKTEVPDSIERFLKMEYFLAWHEYQKYSKAADPEAEDFYEPPIQDDLEHFLNKERFYDKRMKFYLDKIKELAEKN